MHLLIDAIIQIIILTIIPCIWWAIIDRKQSSLFNWIGLKKPRVKNKQKYAISFILMTFMSIIPIFLVLNPRFF